MQPSCLKHLHISAYAIKKQMSIDVFFCCCCYFLTETRFFGQCLQVAQCKTGGNTLPLLLSCIRLGALVRNYRNKFQIPFICLMMVNLISNLLTCTVSVIFNTCMFVRSNNMPPTAIKQSEGNSKMERAGGREKKWNYLTSLVGLLRIMILMSYFYFLPLLENATSNVPVV